MCIRDRSIAVYSSENPPKLIEHNNSGCKILKGCTERDLINGSCVFDKIHVKEVTSHFRNGWIFIVVYPRECSNLMFNGHQLINPNLIQPLIIEKVIVKAKKMKNASSPPQQSLSKKILSQLKKEESEMCSDEEFTS
eukprot:TRINITY_DN10129_c0_g2_i10.p1 TRINITY_DN10129_c0_g2~~TRINITY_DN10129_c0_g2_i10.p1  ORF type:complete len:137 (-),score=22.73 TRINITY_DN10129_c0_g2_i10:108-518(-)